MTGKIYIIKNTQNKKVYIGKTFNTIQCRFKEHLRESRKDRTENRKLYRAIRKYGETSFYIELIEENIKEELVNEKEIFYIKEYDSFNNGYNTTLGGDGSRYININENDLIADYLISKSIRHTAKKFNISEDTASLILHNNKVEIFKPNAKRIKIIDLDLEFDTITECAKFLIENDYTSCKSITNIMVALKRGMKGSGKYLKMRFEVLD